MSHRTQPNYDATALIVKRGKFFRVETKITFLQEKQTDGDFSWEETFSLLYDMFLNSAKVFCVL